MTSSSSSSPSRLRSHTHAGKGAPPGMHQAGKAAGAAASASAGAGAGAAQARGAGRRAARAAGCANGAGESGAARARAAGGGAAAGLADRRSGAALVGVRKQELWTPGGAYRPLQTGRGAGGAGGARGISSVLAGLGTVARLDDSFPGPDVGGDDKAGGGIVLPTQGDVLAGEGGGTQVETIEEYKPISDIEYLQELLAIQDNGPKAVGIFGTRNCGILHQQLIEVLAYAIGITGNHIYTSGATGTNAAVIRGALRANEPDLLTVVLPQSLSKQPPESQEELSKVTHVIEMPQNDDLPLIEASRLCNREIIGKVRQVICFLFHDSTLMMETCLEAKQLRKMVTTFFLD